jgi:hypothetical protein
MGFEEDQLMIGKKVDYVFIGSCTNGRIEDFRAFASIVKGRKKADHITAWIVPGSHIVEAQIKEEGIFGSIEKILKEDLMFFNQLKNKYYTYKETINIFKGITDDDTRNYLYTIIHKFKSIDKYLIKFDVWGIYIRHAIKISDVFKVNNREVLFIGAGDTIFHSHFITGAGLNRTLDFSVKCANMISNII